MSLQDIQYRFPWLMKPVDLLTFLATPERWSCVLDTVTSGITDAVVVDTTGAGRVLMRALGTLSPIRSMLLSRSPALRDLDWRARQSFWALIWTATVGLQRWPRRASIPVDEAPISLLHAPETYPDFRAPSLVFPSAIPCTEKSLINDLSVQILQLLQDIYPVIASHQPVASRDPQERVRNAYTALHRAVRTPPRWHPDLVEAARNNNLLGALAIGGPFAKLLEGVPSDSNRYLIDLQHLDDYPVRDGLCRLGSRIHFDLRDGTLFVSGIEYQHEMIAPGAPKWDLVEQIALAGLMTHLTVWRQGMEYHAAGLAPVPIATHNLPAAHPLRRLLTAHMEQHLLANYSTHLTLRRSGWDVRALSFPYDTILRYYDDGARTFDIRRLDVRADAARRNIPETLHYPYLPQAIRYWDLIEDYVRAYVEHYYPDERRLEADSVVQIWFDTLDHTIMNGIRSYVPTLTRANLVKLCTLIIYSMSVAHTENSMWNFAPFMPTTVRKDGVAPSVGEVQMTLDFQYLITSQTTVLLYDMSHLALDREAAQIMRAFRSKLWQLQRDMEREPNRYWHLYPKEILASVSS